MGKLFGENPTKNDIKNTILNNIDYVVYVDNSIVQKGIKAFNNFDTEIIISYSKCVDSIFNVNNRKNANHKLPTILCGSILLNQFEDVSKLDDEQLATLAHFIYIGSFDYINSCIKIYDSSILSEICSKTKNWYDRESILEVTEDTYDMFFIEGDDRKDIHNKLSQFVKNTTLEEFLELKRELDERIREYIEKEELNI